MILINRHAHDVVMVVDSHSAWAMALRTVLTLLRSVRHRTVIFHAAARHFDAVVMHLTGDAGLRADAAQLLSITVNRGVEPFLVLQLSRKLKRR